MSTSVIVQDRIDVPMGALVELCRRYHVRELALFGSVLRDDFRDDSDIDILVEYEPDASVTLFDHFDLAQELRLLLGREIDLVSKRGLRPILRDAILKSLKVVYAT